VPSPPIEGTRLVCDSPGGKVVNIYTVLIKINEFADIQWFYVDYSVDNVVLFKLDTNMFHNEIFYFY